MLFHVVQTQKVTAGTRRSPKRLPAHCPPFGAADPEWNFDAGSQLVPTASTSVLPMLGAKLAEKYLFEIVSPLF